MATIESTVLQLSIDRLERMLIKIASCQQIQAYEADRIHIKVGNIELIAENDGALCHRCVLTVDGKPIEDVTDIHLSGIMGKPWKLTVTTLILDKTPLGADITNRQSKDGFQELKTTEAREEADEAFHCTAKHKA